MLASACELHEITVLAADLEQDIVAWRTIHSETDPDGPQTTSCGYPGMKNPFAAATLGLQEAENTRTWVYAK